MADNIVFSVIIPVYNCKEYLRKCFNSLLSQENNGIEIIVVDDGSTDGSECICNEYAMQYKNVKVIHKKNEGVSIARNTGVKLARGKYLIFVDSDDYVHGSFFKEFFYIYERYSPDMICCGYTIDRKGEFWDRPIPQKGGLYSRSEIEEQVFPIMIHDEKARYFRPSIWAKAIKRSCYEKNQFVDPNVFIGEDTACIIPCIFHAQSLYIITKCLYYYVDNSSSLTKSRKVYSWNGPEKIGKHIEKNVDLSVLDFEKQLYRKIVHELFTVAVSRFNSNKSYRLITLDIKKNLKRPYYNNAIRKSEFHGSLKAMLMKVGLQHNLCFLMYLYNRFMH